MSLADEGYAPSKTIALWSFQVGQNVRMISVLKPFRRKEGDAVVASDHQPKKLATPSGGWW